MKIDPRIRESLSTLIFRFGLDSIAREVRGHLDRKTRDQRLRDEQDMAIYRDAFVRIEGHFRHALARPRGHALVVGTSGARFILHQLPMLAGIAAHGLEPVIVLPSRSNKIEREFYTRCGVRQFAYWHEQPRSRDVDAILARLGHCQTQQDVIDLSWQGVAIGKYAVSTTMRALRSGKLDPRDPDAWPHLEVMLRRTAHHAAAAIALVEAYRPEVAVFVDRGYTPEGPLFEVCLNRGIRPVTYNSAHRDNTLMLKRYGSGNSNVHPSSISVETWAGLREMPWTDGHWLRLRTQLEYCYQSGQWYGEVGTQFQTQLCDVGALRSELKLDPGKKTVLLFPHIFWDATFFWGRDLFDGYEEWFRAAVAAAWKNDRVNWIIKVHPANVVKNERDGVGTEFSENLVLAEFGPAPGHIRVIPANTRISTLSLYSIADVCLTVRGTVGIEAAAYGLSVITAGTGRYDGLGFTIDAQHREHYLELLSDLQNIAAPSSAQIELARRYAYGVFLSRPLELSAICFDYARERGAPLRIRIQDAAKENLLSCPDVVAIGRWLESGAEDFVSAGLPREAIPGSAESSMHG